MSRDSIIGGNKCPNMDRLHDPSLLDEMLVIANKYANIVEAIPNDIFPPKEVFNKYSRTAITSVIENAYLIGSMEPVITYKDFGRVKEIINANWNTEYITEIYFEIAEKIYAGIPEHELNAWIHNEFNCK